MWIEASALFPPSLARRHAAGSAAEGRPGLAPSRGPEGSTGVEDACNTSVLETTHGGGLSRETNSIYTDAFSDPALKFAQEHGS
eukprot:441209-Pyramimonas_sp.AAC.1